MKNWLFSTLSRFTGDNVRMHFERVYSLSIAEIGYEPHSKTLGVVYINGLVYIASDFPKSEFEKLRNSEFDREFPKVVLANFQLERKDRRAPLFV